MQEMQQIGAKFTESATSIMGMEPDEAAAQLARAAKGAQQAGRSPVLQQV